MKKSHILPILAGALLMLSLFNGNAQVQIDCDGNVEISSIVSTLKASGETQPKASVIGDLTIKPAGSNSGHMVQELRLPDLRPARYLATNENFEVGDVAFGKEYNEISRMCYTRNNVLVIIHAPTVKAKKIAKTIDEEIKNAPVWKKETPKPLFNTEPTN